MNISNLALPCLGPLAPRGAVGARHGGLPRQFSPLLSEGFAGPLRDVVDPDLFRPAPSSTAFDCSLEVSLWLCRPILSSAHTISVFDALQLPGDLRTVIIFMCLNDGFPHMLVSDSVFVGDAKDISETSKL